MWLLVSGCCCCLCSPGSVVQQTVALSAAGGVVSQAEQWPAVYSLCGCRSTVTYREMETAECHEWRWKKRKKFCILSICSCLSCQPVELERGAHRKQHKGNHCVTNGNLCCRPCDDIIHKLVSWRTQEVRSYIVPHLKEKREHNIKKRRNNNLNPQRPWYSWCVIFFTHNIFFRKKLMLKLGKANYSSLYNLEKNTSKDKVMKS